MELLRQAEFWVAIAFVILIAAVWRPAQRALLAGLDERARKIRAELQEAQRLRDEAERILTAYRKKQSKALGEVAEIAKQAAGEAERSRRQAQAELEASLKRREQQAMDRIAQAEAKAVEELHALAVDLAIAATRRLLKDHLDPARAAALVDRAIAELPQRLG
jgi:F-type H+-transporting ATPase subunit b